MEGGKIMAYETTFGLFIDWRENVEQQFKMFAEGINFNDNVKLTAKPTGIHEDTETLNWVVYDEDGNKRADVIFNRRPEQPNFTMQTGQRMEIDSMLNYSTKVIANQEIL